MAILEAGIIHSHTILVEKKFYPSDDFLNPETRTGLINSIANLADQAFEDEIQKFSIGDFIILIISSPLEDPADLKKKLAPLYHYCIIEEKTNQKAVKKAMRKALDQFLNRYSFFDIQTKKIHTFRKFKKRFKKIFSDLALKLEDRFKSLY